MADEIRIEMVEAQPINVEIVEAETVIAETLVPGEKGPAGPPGKDAEISVPPAGKFRIVNFYVNAERKLVVEYDDQPVL